MIRIAISAENDDGLKSVIGHHFGRGPYFVLVDLEDEVIQNIKIVDNPYFNQHQPGMIPGFINSHEVDVMLSDGVGRRTISYFQQYDIQVASGATGT